MKLRIKGQTPIPSGTRLVTEMGELALPFDEVSGKGNTFVSTEELQDWIASRCRYRNEADRRKSADRSGSIPSKPRPTGRV